MKNIYTLSYPQYPHGLHKIIIIFLRKKENECFVYLF